MKSIGGHSSLWDCSHLDVRYEDQAKVCQGEEDVEWQRGDLASEQLVLVSFLICGYTVYTARSHLSLHCTALYNKLSLF